MDCRFPSAMLRIRFSRSTVVFLSNEVDPEILERYAGRYEISTGGMAIVRGPES